MAPDPCPEVGTLYLATGALDDTRRPAGLFTQPQPAAASRYWEGWRDGKREAEQLRSIALYAFERRDVWDEDETRAYWRVHLDLWQRTRGIPTTESTAFSIFMAMQCLHGLALPASMLAIVGRRIPLNEAIAAHGKQRRNLSKDVLATVERLELEAERGDSHDVLYPRVMTHDEYFSPDRPLLGRSALSPLEEARATRRESGVALDAVYAEAGQQARTAMIRELAAWSELDGRELARRVGAALERWERPAAGRTDAERRALRVAERDRIVAALTGAAERQAA